MAWIVSILTIISMELMIRKHRAAWVVSLANQALWLIYICLLREWGLLPLNAAMWVQSIRGLRQWRHSPAAGTASSPAKDR